MTHSELDALVSRQHGRWLLPCVVAVIIAMLGVNLYLVHRETRLMMEQSSRAQRDLVDSMAGRLQTTVEKADMLAMLLAQDYLRTRSDQGDSLFRPVLAKTIERNPDLDLAVIADATGRGLTGSLSRHPPVFFIHDRPYFQYHRSHADDRVHIAKPVTSRAGNRCIIPVSRRVSDAKGVFVGVAMVGISVEFLERDIARFHTGENNVIGIAHTDGTILVRSPSLGVEGHNIKGTTQFSEHYDLQRAGEFTGVSPIDGQKRRYMFRALEGYPLLVVTAIADADPLAIWARALLLKSGYVLLVSLLLALLAIYLYRQQRSLGKTLGLNHAIINSTACGIIAVARDDRVILFNRAAARLLGCRQADGYLPGLIALHDPADLREVLSQGGATEVPDDLSALSYQRVLDAAVTHPRPEWQLRRADGETFPATLNVAPVRDLAQEEIAHVIVFEDLTRAKALEQMKSDFVSVVSHELRTPLTAISGAIAIIGATMKTTATPQQTKLLSVASDSCGRLIRLVSDILDLNRLDRGQMQLHREEQSLLPLLEQAITLNEPYAIAHQVRYRMINTTSDPWVDIDRDRMLQVLTNLMSNAVKFSSPGTEVRLRVTTTDSEVVVAVEDDGAGIPATFQPHVFERFTQSGAVATRSKGGSGLGLSIAKGFVDAHGGTLSFSSAEGKGTAFFLTLPLVVCRVMPVAA